MGKKNKDSKYDKLSYFGKREADKRMAKEYGIDVSEYGNGGRPGENYTNKKSYDDLKRDVARAAANDYDVRRSIEAAQLSGNKKAQKIGSISNASEAYAATRFMEKTHKKRMGNGGNYDGANDQGNVTKYWVNKDRDKLTESFSSNSEPSDDEQTGEAITPTDTFTEPSEETVKARETVKAWQDSNLGGDVYGTKSTSPATSAFEQEKKRAVSTNVDEFVANYKNDVYKGAKMRPDIPV